MENPSADRVLEARFRSDLGSETIENPSADRVLDARLDVDKLDRPPYDVPLKTEANDRSELSGGAGDDWRREGGDTDLAPTEVPLKTEAKDRSELSDGAGDDWRRKGGEGEMEETQAAVDSSGWLNRTLSDFGGPVVLRDDLRGTVLTGAATWMDVVGTR